MATTPEDEPTKLPPAMRIHHVLPEEDIIEHVGNMDCLCTPYVEQVVDLEDKGSVVVVQHRTFESTKPKINWPFGGGLFGGGFGGWFPRP